MQSTDAPQHRLTFYMQYRILIFVLAPLLILLLLFRGYGLYGLIEILLCLAMLFLVYRRRLTLTEGGLEYRSAFTTIHAQWSEVQAVVRRRPLGPLPLTVESLSISRGNLPQEEHAFIPLTQFGKWRQSELGKVLQERLPTLFP